MKLLEFIKALECIAKKTNNPEVVEVKMADYIPAVTPILKDDTVFITDYQE